MTINGRIIGADLYIRVGIIIKEIVSALTVLWNINYYRAFSARATGNVGVAIVTSGPGATNTVTALATAYGVSTSWKASVPIKSVLT